VIDGQNHFHAPGAHTSTAHPTAMSGFAVFSLNFSPEWPPAKSDLHATCGNLALYTHKYLHICDCGYNFSRTTKGHATCGNMYIYMYIYVHMCDCGYNSFRTTKEFFSCKKDP